MIKSELLSYFLYEKNKKYCLLQIWNENNECEYLTLILTDYLNYWTSCCSKSEIENASNLHDFDIESIKFQFLQAFRENIGKNFSIKLTGLEKKNLELKKVIESEIKVKIVSLDLKIVEDPSEMAEKVLEYSIQRINNLDSKIDILENEVKRLTNDRNEAVQNLKECVEQKEQIEYDLYSKFVEVLNEKKAKIRDLTQMDD